MKQKQVSEKKQNIQQKTSQPSVRSKVSDRVRENSSLQAQGIIGNHGVLRHCLTVQPPSGEAAVRSTTWIMSENGVHKESLESTAIRGVGGSGSAVPHKAEMERVFGRDFSRVRVHTDPVAQEAAKALRAKAYSVGSHIAFASTIPDKEIVAHELTHVVQRRAGFHGKRVTTPWDKSEQVAQRIGQVVGSAATEVGEIKASIGENTIALFQVDINTSTSIRDREEFWDEYQERLKRAMARWWTVHLDNAIDDFHSSLRLVQSPSSERVLLDAFFDLISPAGIYGSLADAVGDVFLGLYDGFGQPGSTMTVAGFIDQLRLSAEDVAENIDSIEPGEESEEGRREGAGVSVCRRVTEAKNGEPEGNHTVVEEYRQGIVDEVNGWLENLPGRRPIMQAIVADWLDCAQSSSREFGEWGGVTAGYISVRVGYIYNGMQFSSISRLGYSTPFLDDVSSPDAIKAAMVLAFGEDAYLDDVIGIDMNLEVVVTSAVGAYIGIIRFIKTRNSTNLNLFGMNLIPMTHYFAGPSSVSRQYKQWENRPRVRDLTCDYPGRHLTSYFRWML